MTIRLSRLLAWTVLLLAPAAALAQAPAEHSAPADLLALDAGADSALVGSRIRQVSQALMTGVASGDTALWDRYLADDAMLTDENGDTHTKREVLASLRPLPPGFSGQIHVEHAIPHVRGDLATLTYDAMEDEVVFGQHIGTRYRTTDIYAWRHGRWRLFGSHTSVIPSEHSAVPGDTVRYGDYVGEYAVSQTMRLVVTSTAAHLYAGSPGHPPAELFPLGPDRFFRKGAPRGERLFVRDPAGRVVAMIDRRDNNDLVWRRH
ncbi:MAG TPA: nuclear transport factor 2 family protein [Gemmatimonadales bacterium]|nr:nuclear transport factor 2 family protein [Gemmatimonadales bacterium]